MSSSSMATFERLIHIQAPIAHELGTSAASCRMRWHCLKGSATLATWEQQQQYLWQHLRLSVHQQGPHQTLVQPAQPTNDNPPTLTFQTLYSSSTAQTHHHSHHRQEVVYFNPEFDDYLQRVLWEDEDFVRAVDAIYQEEKNSICSSLPSMT